MLRLGGKNGHSTEKAIDSQLKNCSILTLQKRNPLETQTIMHC